jgi:hypothetical protein
VKLATITTIGSEILGNGQKAVGGLRQILPNRRRLCSSKECGHKRKIRRNAELVLAETFKYLYLLFAPEKNAGS